MERIIKYSIFCMIILFSSFAYADNLTYGLVHYYPLDNNASDIIGTDDLAVYTPALVTGCRNSTKCYDFDGNDRLYNNSRASTSVQGTINFWVKLDTMAVADTIIHTNNPQQYYCQWLNNGQGGLFCDFPNNDHTFTVQVTGEWAMYTITHDADSNNFHRNGTFEAIKANTVTMLPVNLHFGCDIGGSTCIDGRIDEIMMWDRQLNNSEVEYLWNNGTGHYYPFELPSEIPPAPLIENATLILKNESLVVYDYNNNISEYQNFYIFANYTVDNASNSDGECYYQIENMTSNWESLSYDGGTHLYKDQTNLWQYNYSGEEAGNITLKCNNSLYNFTFDVTPYPRIQNATLILKNETLSVYDYNSNISEFQNFYVFVNYTFNGESITGGDCEYTIENITESPISLSFNSSTKLYDDFSNLHYYGFSGENAGNITINCNDSLYNFTFDVTPFPRVQNATLILYNTSLDGTFDYNSNMTEQQDEFYVRINYTFNGQSNKGADCSYQVETLQESWKSATWDIVTQLYQDLTASYIYTIAGENVGNITLKCNNTLYNFTFDVTDVLLDISIDTINGGVFSNGTEITPLDVNYINTTISGDNISSIDYNVTYENGTFIKNGATSYIELSYNEIKESSTYNFTVVAYDNENNPTTQTGHFNVSNFIIVHSPLNDTSNNSDPLNFTHETNFAFSKCSLYTNFSIGTFWEVDNMSKVLGYDNNIVGYWKFEESSGNISYDSSNYNKDGDIFGASYVSSRGGNGTGSYALYFDGTNDRINFGDIANFDNTDPFSFCFWFNTTTSSVDVLFDRYISSRGWSIYMSSGNIIISFATDGTHFIKKTSDNTYNDGDWHYFSLSYDGNSTAGGFILYIDGETVPMTTNSNTLDDTTLNNANCTVGARETALYYEGYMDELVLFNYTINQTEVTTFYNQGVQPIPESYFSAFTNYTNLSHDLPVNTYTDILYYIECNTSGGEMVNSSQILVHYNNDFTAPEVTQVYPSIINHTNIQYVNITIELNELGNCTHNNTDWQTLLYTNGSYFIFNETGTTENGFYSIPFNCTDNINNSAITYINFTIDRILPNITWIKPLYDGSTQYQINQTSFINLEFTDDNLFAYEIEIYDANNILRYNYTLVDINISTYTFQEYIVPDLLGTWNVSVIVSDDHTKKDIEDYDYNIKDDKKVNFKFEKIKNREKKYKNVSIEYTGKYAVKNLNVNKNKDRYSFGYEFAVLEDKKLEKLDHKFRVECDNIYFRPNSQHIAHFVCYDTMTWIDFDSSDIIDWNIEKCGETCYDINLETKNKEIIEFNSIGGLNYNNESATFEVVEQIVPPITGYTLLDFDISQTSNVFLLFVLGFLWLGTMALGWFFHNIGFKSLGFFLGLILGIMLGSFHIILAIMFFLLNTTLLIAGMKSK